MLCAFSAELDNLTTDLKPQTPRSAPAGSQNAAIKTEAADEHHPETWLESATIEDRKNAAFSGKGDFLAVTYTENSKKKRKFIERECIPTSNVAPPGRRPAILPTAPHPKDAVPFSSHPKESQRPSKRLASRENPVPSIEVHPESKQQETPDNSQDMVDIAVEDDSCGAEDAVDVPDLPRPKKNTRLSSPETDNDTSSDYAMSLADVEMEESEDDSPEPQPCPSKPPRETSRSPIAPTSQAPGRRVPMVLVTPLPWFDRIIVRAGEAAGRPSSSSLEVEPRIYQPPGSSPAQPSVEEVQSRGSTNESEPCNAWAEKFLGHGLLTNKENEVAGPSKRHRSRSKSKSVEPRPAAIIGSGSRKKPGVVEDEPTSESSKKKRATCRAESAVSAGTADEPAAATLSQEQPHQPALPPAPAPSTTQLIPATASTATSNSAAIASGAQSQRAAVRAQPGRRGDLGHTGNRNGLNSNQIQAARDERLMAGFEREERNRAAEASQAQRRAVETSTTAQVAPVPSRVHEPLVVPEEMLALRRLINEALETAIHPPHVSAFMATTLAFAQRLAADAAQRGNLFARDLLVGHRRGY